MGTKATISVAPPAPLLPDNPLYEQYFDGLRTGRIRVRECTECGTRQWPPRELCGACQGSSFVPRDVPTTGEVYTYTVMYRAFHPWFKDQLPYGVAVVEVEGGIRIIGRYVGDDPEGLACGQRMEAVFDDLGEDGGSIAWRPA
ncbi:hypothetical protein GCM10022262_33800 [Georgenia daeguensis]|uniref:DNA-binding protein n=1 Tax=Georgenia daeguensis TaxID=908355 RepID=A0ABP8EYE8_9MICO